MGSEGWGEEGMFRGGMEKKWYFKTLKLVWGKGEWDEISRGRVQVRGGLVRSGGRWERNA